MFEEKLAKGEAEVRTAEDEEKDVLLKDDTKNEKEEDSGEQEYITDIIENITEKKFKIPSYKYCRQNQIFIGMDYKIGKNYNFNLHEIENNICAFLLYTFIISSQEIILFIQVNLWSRRFKDFIVSVAEDLCFWLRI